MRLVSNARDQEMAPSRTSREALGSIISWMRSWTRLRRASMESSMRTRSAAFWPGRAVESLASTMPMAMIFWA